MRTHPRLQAGTDGNRIASLQEQDNGIRNYPRAFVDRIDLYDIVSSLRNIQNPIPVIGISGIHLQSDMTASAFLIIAMLVTLAAISLVWRRASRRHSLPCPAWLRWFVELDNPFTRTTRATVIIEHLDVRPGRVALPLARQVGPQGEVVAMDIQPGMLQRVRDRLRDENGSHLRLVLAGLGEGKLDRDCFDRAVLVTVLGEIPDREAAMKELFDTLKPGGILSVTETVFDPHYQPRGTVTRLAMQCGFHEHAYFGNCLAFTLNLQKPARD